MDIFHDPLRRDGGAVGGARTSAVQGGNGGGDTGIGQGRESGKGMKESFALPA